jgi:succinyl-diaminopimelate desuccinylase
MSEPLGVMPDREAGKGIMKEVRVVTLLRELIKIPSENPPGDERAIAAFIMSFLKTHGYRPRRVAYAPGRDNVILTAGKIKTGKRILLSPHIDTVPAGQGWKHGPFEAVVEKGKVYGRGAADCKINVAVSLEILAQLAERSFELENLDIVYAATADEETGSAQGFVPLVKELPVCDYALVLDGEDFKIENAQKGLRHVTVTLYGKRAHGAYVERGDNAAVRAFRFYQQVERMVEDFNRRDRNRLMTVNMGVIEAGDKVNMVPDCCRMQLDFRFMGGDTGKLLMRELKSLAKQAARKAEVQAQHSQEPCLCPRETALAQSLEQALRRNKRPVRYELSKGATVLSYIPKKTQAVIMGFGDPGVFHCTNEYVSVKNIIDGVGILRETLLELDKNG